MYNITMIDRLYVYCGFGLYCSKQKNVIMVLIFDICPSNSLGGGLGGGEGQGHHELIDESSA